MLSRSARSLLLSVVTLAACGGNANDIQELKKGQKDILAKLEGLDKTVQQVKTAAAQPAAAPQRPQMDPNKVYTIPIGTTPVRGPKAAKVTIAEFSDFQ
jgi:protein-disulfide isomerase